jgi:hypothetical protein
VVVTTSEPEMFEDTGRIEEDDRQADPVTPDVPIPPVIGSSAAAEPDDRPASPGPATEPPD